METRNFLIYLRDALVVARQVNDLERINRMMMVFSFLAEFSYAVHNQSVSSLIEDMEDSARDSLHGVEWKSKIPSNEEIDLAFRR